MHSILIRTKRHKQVIDITEDINRVLKENSYVAGWCLLFISHTTAALTTADLDPGTDQDMLDAFAEMLPKLNYRHPHNPSHVGDHIMSSIIGPSVIVPAENGRLVLGTWQRVVLVEFNGPRERTIFTAFVKEK